MNQDMSAEIKVLEIIYEDALAPSARKVGTALGLVIESALHASRISKLEEYNLRKNTVLKNNLEKIRTELSTIDEVKEVPIEIATPIIDRLSYIADEELSALFIELLVKSASSNDSYSVHPSFVHVIDSLAPDEAKIIKTIYEDKEETQWSYPMISYGTRNTDPKMRNQEFIICENYCKLYEIASALNCKENIELYIENMTTLGLLNSRKRVFLPQLDPQTGINIPHRDYASLEDSAKKIFKAIPPLEFYSSNGILSITNFGKKFIQSACKN